MMDIKYKLSLWMCKILHKDDMEIKILYYRKKGAMIGEHVRAFSPITAAEPYLIEVGDNTTISSGVVFLTHDNSVIKLPVRMGTDLVGRVTIGKNCFIGCNTILLPGVAVGDNIIIGAGSVVSRSCMENGAIYAGNPAKRIGRIADFASKNEKFIFDFEPNGQKLSYSQRKELIMENSSKLIKK